MKLDYDQCNDVAGKLILLQDAHRDLTDRYMNHPGGIVDSVMGLIEKNDLQMLTFINVHFPSYLSKS